MAAPDLAEANFSLYDILEDMRRSAPLLIAERELVRVYAFLIGCQYALGRQGFTFRHAEPNFWRFHDWVAQRLGYTSSTSGWYNMIRDGCGTEQEAFDRFYGLLAEFRATAGTVTT